MPGKYPDDIDKLDEFYKEHLDDLEMDPKPSDWNAISSKLGEPARKSGFARRLYIGGGIVITGILVYFLFFYEPKKTATQDTTDPDNPGKDKTITTEQPQNKEGRSKQETTDPVISPNSAIPEHPDRPVNSQSSEVSPTQENLTSTSESEQTGIEDKVDSSIVEKEDPVKTTPEATEKKEPPVIEKKTSIYDKLAGDSSLKKKNLFGEEEK